MQKTTNNTWGVEGVIYNVVMLCSMLPIKINLIQGCIENPNGDGQVGVA